MSDQGLPATLTVKQTSELIGLSIRATYRAIEAGHIPVIRLGRRVRVLTAPLVQLLGITATNGVVLDQSPNGDGAEEVSDESRQ